MKQDANADSTPPSAPGVPVVSPPAPGHPATAGFAGRTLKSAELFGDSRELCIDHGGACYRLRVTQNNKLILTK